MNTALPIIQDFEDSGVTPVVASPRELEEHKTKMFDATLTHSMKQAEKVQTLGLPLIGPFGMVLMASDSVQRGPRSPEKQ